MSEEFFKNLPDTSTPLNASRLNGLLNGNESMGKIMVEDVKCKNLLNINVVTLDNYSILGFDISNLEIGKTYTFSSNLPVKSFKISAYSDGYNSVVKDEESGFTTFTFTMNRHNNIAVGTRQYLFLAITGIWEWVKNISELDGYELQIEEGTNVTEYTPSKSFGYTSGKNENGSWIKYDDGTMKQWGSGVFSNGGNVNVDSFVYVNFPQTFIGDKNTYSYTTTYMSGSADPINACLRTKLTGSRYYGDGNSRVSQDVIYRRLTNAPPDGAEQIELYKVATRFNWEAKGRWK